MACSLVDTPWLSTAFAIVGLGWPLLELVLIGITRRNRAQAVTRDRGSQRWLWAAIGAGFLAAGALRASGVGRMPWPEPWLLGAGLVVLLAGLALRAAAVLSLGRFFTTSVAIRSDHRLVSTGLYRFLRHPSYAGLLLAFAGLGIGFGNWLGLAALTLPVAAALHYRVHVEETALAEAFGSEYDDYRRRTRRLIPWVY